MAAVTRLGLYGGTRGLYGDFSAKPAYAGPLWYVDASAGAGGDGSVGSPFDTLADATAVASDGDTIYVAAGTYTEELIVTNLDIDIVGDGAATTIIDAEDTRDSAATLSSMGGTISGITFTRGAKYGLLISNQSGNFDAYATIVSNCVASSCRTASTTVGYGVGFQVNNANNVQSTITYEDCTAHSNGRMGFDTQEVQGTITRTRCTAYSNGDLGPGGGFYTHGWRASATSGWTGTAAPVYSRAKLSGLDGFGGMYNETDSEFLKIAATPTTTPAEGECSAVGSTMYVRLPGDANPAGKTIKWSRSDLTVVDTDLTAYSNGGYDDEHGSGIQYDDFTQNVTARRLTVYNNTGRGLRSFLANDLDIASVYAYNNATNSGTGNQKANITLDGWNVTLGNATSTGADVAYSSGQGAQTFRNLVSDNCTTVLRADNGTTMGATLTVDYYVYNGQTTVSSANNSATISATNGTAGDPILTADGKLTQGSPAIGAGAVWWAGALLDVDGNAFDGTTPNVGAFAGFVASTTSTTGGWYERPVGREGESDEERRRRRRKRREELGIIEPEPIEAVDVPRETPRDTLTLRNRAAARDIAEAQALSRTERLRLIEALEAQLDERDKARRLRMVAVLLMVA